MTSKAIIQHAILSGDARTAETLTRQWLASGHSAREFCDEVLFPAVETIAQHVCYLPELLIALRAAKAALCVVDEAAGGENRPRHGTVVVGSLGCCGDGLCRNVVAGLLAVSGWNVVDLGGGIMSEQFVDACVEAHASALVVTELLFATSRLSPEMPRPAMASIVEGMITRGIRQSTRVLFVGRAFDDLRQGPHRVDVVCSDLAEVLAAVPRLLTDASCHAVSG